MKKKIFVLVLATVVASAAFSQEADDKPEKNDFVIGIDFGLDFDNPSDGSLSDTKSSYHFDTSLGYRIKNRIGFGVVAGIEGGQDWDAKQADIYKLNYNTEPLEFYVGAYFEHVLANKGKASLFAIVELGYTGRLNTFEEDVAIAGLGNHMTVKDQNGFYAWVTPVFEYRLFKHISLFASTALVEFYSIKSRHKRYLDETALTWKEVPHDMAFLENTETVLHFPFFTHIGLTDITIGFKILL